jgi:hypothetical protein
MYHIYRIQVIIVKNINRIIMARLKTEVNIVPDPSFIGKLGRRAKNLPETVAELVDNSLDAFWMLPKSKRERKTLQVYIEADHETFSIQDNAKGMTPTELGNAFVVGATEKEGKKSMIGSHGFGLKSATMHIADEVVIYSMHYSDPKTVNVVTFNRIEFEARAKKIKLKEKDPFKAIQETWRLEVESLMPSDVAEHVHFPEKHGTKIVLKHNGKYKSGSKEGIQNRMRKIFAPLLGQEEGAQRPKAAYKYEFDMKIIWRGKGGKNEVLTGSGPFYTARLDEAGNPIKKGNSSFSKGSQKKEPAVLDLIDSDTYVDIPKKNIGGKTVYGRAAIIDRSQYHDGKYGFDLLRNGRVVEFNVLDAKASTDEGHEITLLSKSADKARIVGQLFMDDWDTDHQKTQFLRSNNEEWHELALHVDKHIRPLFKRSESLQNAGRSKESKVKKQVNEPLHKYADTFKDKIKGSVLRAHKNPKSKSIVEKEVSNKSLRNKILNLTPEVHFDHLGPRASLRRYALLLEEARPIIKITINVDHEIFKGCEVSHWNLMSYFIQLDCLAEVTIKSFANSSNDSLDKFLKQRDQLLSVLKKTKEA